MAIRQISVFLENHSGSLSAVTRVLAEAGVDMRAMAVADTQDFGILRLIVRNTDNAIQALKAHGYLTAVNEVTAAVIPDEPGGLCHLVNLLADEDVNIEYSYAFLREMFYLYILSYTSVNVKNTKRGRKSPSSVYSFISKIR